MFRNAIISALICLMMTPVFAQEVTISNNLLYDATLTPNLQLAVQVSPKWSIGVTGGFRHWPIGNLTKTKWRHLLISPEFRHWTDSLQIGHFFGMNAIYSHFNAGYSDFVIYKGVKDERRQGDLVALGGFYGYSWRLGRRWTFEAFGGLAIGYAWFDRFVINNRGDDWDPIGNDKSFFLLPQLGLNFVYHIPLKSKDSRRYGLTKTTNIPPDPQDSCRYRQTKITNSIN